MPNMTLYEINAAIQEALEKAIDTETGEIIDAEAEKELDGLLMTRDEKIENVGLWIKDLKAEAAALKAEKESFEKRIATANNKIESLKKYLFYALNGEKFKTTRLSVSYRNTRAVNVVDLEAIPDEFCRFTKEARKTDIAEAIKNGATVPGAEVVERQSIIIK